MQQGKKIDDNTRLNIFFDYVETGSYSETARKFNISDVAVRKIVLKLKENKHLSKMFENKKREQVENTLQKFEELGKVKNNILNNSLMRIAKKVGDESKDISVSELIRIYGVLMDKEISYASIKKTDNTNEMDKLDEILESIKNDSTNQ